MANPSLERLIDIAKIEESELKSKRDWLDALWGAGFILTTFWGFYSPPDMPKMMAGVFLAALGVIQVLFAHASYLNVKTQRAILESLACVVVPSVEH